MVTEEYTQGAGVEQERQLIPIHRVTQVTFGWSSRDHGLASKFKGLAAGAEGECAGAGGSETESW